MKKLILSVAVLGALSASVHAQTAPTPEHTFTGNLTLASDYRFRGISQTFKRPALQGGFDYAHSSGFYLGNWNSNVSGNQFSNGAGLEMDFYGGYKFEPVQDVTADIGLLYYYYPGARYNGSGEKYNNGEIYFGGAYKWFSARYSYGLTDFFGLNNATAATPRGNSRGSGYLDLNASFEVAEKTTLTLHAGRQWVRHYGEFNYNDYKIGIARDFGFATIGLAVIGTDADKRLYTYADGNGRTRKVSETGAVVSISKTF